MRECGNVNYQIVQSLRPSSKPAQRYAKINPDEDPNEERDYEMIPSIEGNRNHWEPRKSARNRQGRNDHNESSAKVILNEYLNQHSDFLHSVVNQSRGQKQHNNMQPQSQLVFREQPEQGMDISDTLRRKPQSRPSSQNQTSNQQQVISQQQKESQQGRLSSLQQKKAQQLMQLSQQKQQSQQQQQQQKQRSGSLSARSQEAVQLIKGSQTTSLVTGRPVSLLRLRCMTPNIRSSVKTSSRGDKSKETNKQIDMQIQRSREGSETERIKGQNREIIQIEKQKALTARNKENSIGKANKPNGIKENGFYLRTFHLITDSSSNNNNNNNNYNEQEQGISIKQEVKTNYNFYNRSDARTATGTTNRQKQLNPAGNQKNSSSLNNQDGSSGVYINGSNVAGVSLNSNINENSQKVSRLDLSGELFDDDKKRLSQQKNISGYARAVLNKGSYSQRQRNQEISEEILDDNKNKDKQHKIIGSMDQRFNGEIFEIPQRKVIKKGNIKNQKDISVNNCIDIQKQSLKGDNFIFDNKENDVQLHRKRAITQQYANVIEKIGQKNHDKSIEEQQISERNYSKSKQEQRNEGEQDIQMKVESQGKQQLDNKKRATSFQVAQVRKSAEVRNGCKETKEEDKYQHQQRGSERQNGKNEEVCLNSNYDGKNNINKIDYKLQIGDKSECETGMAVEVNSDISCFIRASEDEEGLQKTENDKVELELNVKKQSMKQQDSFKILPCQNGKQKNYQGGATNNLSQLRQNPSNLEENNFCSSEAPQKIEFFKTNNFAEKVQEPIIQQIVNTRKEGIVNVGNEQCAQKRVETFPNKENQEIITIGVSQIKQSDIINDQESSEPTQPVLAYPPNSNPPGNTKPVATNKPNKQKAPWKPLNKNLVHVSKFPIFEHEEHELTTEGSKQHSSDRQNEILPYQSLILQQQQQNPEELLEDYIEENRRSMREISQLQISQQREQQLNLQQNTLYQSNSKVDIDKLLEQSATVYDPRCPQPPIDLEILEEIKVEAKGGELSFGRESQIFDSMPRVRYFRCIDRQNEQRSVLMVYALHANSLPALAQEWVILQDNFKDIGVNKDNKSNSNGFNIKSELTNVQDKQYQNNCMVRLLSKGLVFEERPAEYTWFLHCEDFYGSEAIVSERFKQRQFYQESELLVIFKQLLEHLIEYKSLNVTLPSLLLSNIVYCPQSQQYKFLSIAPRNYRMEHAREQQSQTQSQILQTADQFECSELALSFLSLKYLLVSSNRNSRNTEKYFEICRNTKQTDISARIINELDILKTNKDKIDSSELTRILNLIQFPSQNIPKSINDLQFTGTQNALCNIPKQTAERIQAAADIGKMYRATFQWEKAATQFLDTLEAAKMAPPFKFAERELLRALGNTWQCLYFLGELEDALHYCQIYFAHIQQSQILQDELQLSQEHLLAGKLKWLLQMRLESSQDLDIALLCAEQAPLLKASILIQLGDFFAFDEEISAEHYYTDALLILQQLELLNVSYSQIVKRLLRKLVKTLQEIEQNTLKKLLEKETYLKDNQSNLSINEIIELQFDIANQKSFNAKNFTSAEMYYSQALNSIQSALNNPSGSVEQKLQQIGQNLKDLKGEIQKNRILNFLKANKGDEAKLLIADVLKSNEKVENVKNIDCILQIAILLEENRFLEISQELYKTCLHLSETYLGPLNEFSLRLKEKLGLI